VLRFLWVRAPADEILLSLPVRCSFNALTPLRQVFKVCDLPRAISMPPPNGVHVGCCCGRSWRVPELRSATRFHCPPADVFVGVKIRTRLDTGITIANTSADPFWNQATNGACVVFFFGNNAYAVLFITPTIQRLVRCTHSAASVQTPNFQRVWHRRLFISHKPTDGHTPFLSALRARGDAFEVAEVLLTLPKDRGWVTGLLFSAVAGNEWC